MTPLEMELAKMYSPVHTKQRKQCILYKTRFDEILWHFVWTHAKGDFLCQLNSLSLSLSLSLSTCQEEMLNLYCEFKSTMNTFPPLASPLGAWNPAKETWKFWEGWGGGWAALILCEAKLHISAGSFSFLKDVTDIRALGQKQKFNTLLLHQIR